MSIYFEETENAVVGVLTPNRMEGALLRELKGTLLERARTANLPLLLDMSSVDYVNSAGLTLLVTVEEHMGKGRVHLCCVQPAVQTILKITKLDVMFEVHPDRASAESALAARV